MINIDDILVKLCKERPIFHSEADFKHAFAWTINKQHSDFNIRLEKRIEFSMKVIFRET